MVILWIVISLVILVWFTYRWIAYYNLFQHLKTSADKLYADVHTITQQRLDNLNALATIAAKYNVHEYGTITDTIKARGSFNSAKSEQPLSPFNIQALMEQYPNLKSNEMFVPLMTRDSEIENLLREARMKYNRTVRRYNQNLIQFPSHIVANTHHFEALRYITLPSQEAYLPKDLFKDTLAKTSTSLQGYQ